MDTHSTFLRLSGCLVIGWGSMERTHAAPFFKVDCIRHTNKKEDLENQLIAVQAEKLRLKQKK